MPKRRSRRESGFTLVALVIAIAILTILIAGVAPSIGTIMKREREEELIFRGKQYARAIALFQRRYGRYPNELKELYENRPRTIRKLFKDPMCSCDFHPIIQGTADAMTGISGAPPPPGSPQFPPGAPFPATPPPPPTPTPISGPFGPAGGESKTIGPIVGVRSTVHKEALREWRGQKFYDTWRFIVNDADREYLGQGGRPVTIPGAPQFPPTAPTPVN